VSLGTVSAELGSGETSSKHTGTGTRSDADLEKRRLMFSSVEKMYVEFF